MLHVFAPHSTHCMLTAIAAYGTKVLLGYLVCSVANASAVVGFLECTQASTENYGRPLQKLGWQTSYRNICNFYSTREQLYHKNESEGGFPWLYARMVVDSRF